MWFYNKCWGQAEKSLAPTFIIEPRWERAASLTVSGLCFRREGMVLAAQRHAPPTARRSGTPLSPSAVSNYLWTNCI